jgi:hypothetical protein
VHSVAQTAKNRASLGSPLVPTPELVESARRRGAFETATTRRARCAGQGAAADSSTTAQGAHLFLQLVSRRYERGAIILTSNQSLRAWRHVFGAPVIAHRHPGLPAPPTVHQFRSVLTGEEPYRFIVDDRDAAFAVDNALRSMTRRALETPVRAPQANAFCRLIGSVSTTSFRSMNGICARSWPSGYPLQS